MNQTKHFHFSLPVNHNNIHVGDVEVIGIGSNTAEGYETEINQILWQGTDLKELIEYNSFGWSDDKIWEIAMSHVMGLFEEEELEDNRRMEEDQEYQDGQEMILEMQKTL